MKEWNVMISVIYFEIPKKEKIQGGNRTNINC